jgi:hypothetical protein
MNATRSFCYALVVLGFVMPAIASGHQYRLVVKFASQCCGTDIASAQQLSDVISEFEKKLSIKLAFEHVWWGKEGEYNQCFKLEGMNDKMKAVFIAQVKSSITSKLVRIEENIACSGGW